MLFVDGHKLMIDSFMQAEQEERRKLEGVVRGLRRENAAARSGLGARDKS